MNYCKLKELFTPKLEIQPLSTQSQWQKEYQMCFVGHLEWHRVLLSWVETSPADTSDTFCL